MRDETGCAVLLVEHNAGFVMQQSDRVVVLNLGSVLAEGLPDEVQRNQAVRDAYLGETARRVTGDRRPKHDREHHERVPGTSRSRVSSTGAIYSIMASGLVLTYTTSGIFNFAHGAVAFATAYLYYQLNTGLGVPIVPALIISVFIFAPLLGLLLDRILLRRLAQAPVYARIVGTIGLLVALPALIQWLVVAVGNDVLGLGLKGNEALTERAARPRGRPDAADTSTSSCGRRAQHRPDRGVRRRRDRRDRALVRHPPHPGRARDARGRRPRAARRPPGRERRADVGGSHGS